MEPPASQDEPRPPARSNRVLGLLAAVGFSVLMWVFIALAVLGLVLKIVGPKDAQEGLAAAGISVPQLFNLDNNEAEPPPSTDVLVAPGAVTGPIIPLNGQPLGPGPASALAPHDAGIPPAAPPPAPPAKSPH